MANYKPMALSTGKISKEEKAKRLEQEAKLRGKNDRIVAPRFLDKKSKKYFKNLVEGLSETGLLGNIDVGVITTTSMALAKLEDLELQLQTTTDIDQQFKIMKMQDMVMKQFHKGVSELGLSPTARVKLNQINKTKEEEKEDPLLKLLSQRRK